MITMSKMLKTWKIGLFVLNLIVLASIVCAGWPSDLTFSVTPSSSTVGTSFIAKLVISPSGGPVTPFKNYVDANISLPAGIVLMSGTDFADLSAVSGINEYQWYLNSTGSVGSPYQINISVNGTQFTNYTTVTINAPVGTPQLVASVSNIPDYSLIGSHNTVTVTINNTGNDVAKNITGFFSAQKANINATSFSIANLNNGSSTSFYVDVVASSAGTGSLTAGFSSYKKSDDTLISSGSAEFNASGATESFIINANPVVEFGSVVHVDIGDNGYNSNYDLDNYVSDNDTAIASLVWSCNSTNNNITKTINPSTHKLNITTLVDGDYSGIMTCSANDSHASGSDSFTVHVHRVNDAPWFTSTAITTGTAVWGGYSYDVNAADPEGDNITYLLNTYPTGMVIDSLTGLISWSPRDVGSYNVDVNISDTANNSVNQSFTIVIVAPTGSGGSSSSAPKIYSVSSITPDKPAVLFVSESHVYISEVSINVLEELSNVKFKFSEVSALPSNIVKPNAKIFQYLSIYHENINDSQIKNATIKFKVYKSWLSSQHVSESDIILKRFVDNKWVDLPTVNIGSDGVFVYYEAVTPGFSYFAIGTKEVAEQVISTPAVKPSEAVNNTVPAEENPVVKEKNGVVAPVEEKKESVEEKNQEGVIVAKEKQSIVPLVILISSIVLLIVGITAYVIKRKGSGKKGSGNGWNKFVGFFVEEEPKKKRK